MGVGQKQLTDFDRIGDARNMRNVKVVNARRGTRVVGETHPTYSRHIFPVKVPEGLG